jgi:mannose-1-phosphate guanylyltransferase
LKAVVLVGGEGTRMRPLTETVPKPLLPLMNRPFLSEVLDRLAEHGVDEVVLSSPYLEETFRPFIDSREQRAPRIVWITETEPLDTAGAIVNALPLLGDEAFFVLNGDILTDLDFTALLRFHRERGAAATITLAHVDDARAFGLVTTDDSARVLEFREKPADPVAGDVNSGTYVLQPEALSGWRRGERVNIEREVFPVLIERNVPVYGFLSEAYWMDLGTPEKYLRAHFDLLEGRLDGRSYDAPLVAADATVDASARIGPRVVLGPGAVVEEDAWVEDSVVHPGAVVRRNATVTRSILGPRSRIGADAIAEGVVLAEGAEMAEGARADGEKVGPGERFPAE